MNFWISSDTWLLNVPCLKQSCGKHFFPIQKASKHQAIYFPKSYYPSTRHGCHTEKFTFHWIGICLISQFLRIQTASWKSQNSDCSLKVRGSLCIFFFSFLFCFFPNNECNLASSTASEGISDKWISRMIFNTYIFSIWFVFNPCFLGRKVLLFVHKQALFLPFPGAIFKILI